MVGSLERQPHRLPGDHQPVVGHRLKGQVMRGEYCILIIPFLTL